MQFGRLPPSFLPLGDKRLYSIQNELALGEPCTMTVREDFVISEIDQQRLREQGIELIIQPLGLRLTQAIGHALTQIKPDGPLRILYGDTLVKMNSEMLCQNDIVAVQDTTANYSWTFVTSDGNDRISFSDTPPKRITSRRIVCGYYTFSDPDLLATACHEAHIVDALNFYNASHPLKPAIADQWFDFGHLQLYFQSKKNVMVKRVFYDLVFEDHKIIKQSSDTLT